MIHASRSWRASWLQFKVLRYQKIHDFSLGFYSGRVPVELLVFGEPFLRRTQNITGLFCDLFKQISAQEFRICRRGTTVWDQTPCCFHL